MMDYGHGMGGAAMPQEPVVLDYAHGKGLMSDAGPPPPFREEMHDPTIPQAPYYDLPAGLMVPLIKLWDCEYKSLDARELRLPIPQPPSERLLAAVEAFYSPPSHDRPRDNQGWEKNGLFEYFKAKLKYIKDKERKLETFERSPSPFLEESEDEQPEERVEEGPSRMMMSRRSRSKSRGRSRSRSRSRGRSRSRSRSKSRSRSRSRSPRRRSRSRSRSRTPAGESTRKGASCSRSRSRSRSKSRSKERSKDRSISPVKRSPTPEQTGFVFTEAKSFDTRLEESNKGHQLLMKMGWGGQGLGKKESGIVDPIKGGEVRDKVDQFKGIGVESDDFQNFRKAKSGSYHTRERR